MKKNILILVLFCSFKQVFPQLQSGELRITYVANEGFLLNSSEKSVLIDALFTDGYGSFPVPSKDVIDGIMGNKPPFEKIDAYFLTHYHKDHCDPALVNDYLAKHKGLPFVTSKPSIVFIHGNCIDFIFKKKQFFELTPDNNQSVSKTINGMPVKVFGLKHMSFIIDSIDIEENMSNVSYLINMNGINVFHSGDIKKETFQSYLADNKKWNDSVDVAFLYFELFNSGEQDLDFIIQTLHPKYIVLMHIPSRLTNEWTPRIEQLKTKFKNILVFNNSMDTQIISIPQN